MLFPTARDPVSLKCCTSGSDKRCDKLSISFFAETVIVMSVPQYRASRRV